jgi:hypothetical protein
MGALRPRPPRPHPQLAPVTRPQLLTIGRRCRSHARAAAERVRI